MSLGGPLVSPFKQDDNLDILKQKTRYIAKTFNQIFGSSYSKSFVRTAILSSIRLLSALATHLHSEGFHFDVHSAYLNKDLEEDVYVEQPPGFEIPRKKSKLVCNLSKGVYGLKQDGKFWNRTLDKFFNDFGLTRSMIDTCFSSKSNLRGNRIFYASWPMIWYIFHRLWFSWLFREVFLCKIQNWGQRFNKMVLGWFHSTIT